MTEWINAAVATLLAWLALPQHGLSTLFVITLLSATLIPMPSEPALVGLITLNPAMLWPGILVATLGNTVGGIISYWMGYGAHTAVDAAKHQPRGKAQLKALQWLERLGPKACLLSWLPIVGDPLCAIAGWLRLSFWPCCGYMLVGKLIRYIVYTLILLWFVPGSQGGF
jgi:membrane protein YqaA with SNARE-associated domain